jgi:hypothetical protein
MTPQEIIESQERLIQSLIDLGNLMLYWTYVEKGERNG